MSVASSTLQRARRPIAQDPSPERSPRRGLWMPSERPTTPPLKVVPDGSRAGRKRLRRRALAIFGVLAALITPFALVLVHVELTANQLRLTTLQTKGDAAQQQYEKLRLQVAQLESPARVVATAQQLGMVTPTTITYLTPSAGSAPTGSTATPATAAGSGVSGWSAAKRVDTGR